MPKFDRLTSRVVPLKVDDIDTDQIIPARYLKVTSKEGLGPVLFTDWRAPGKAGAILDSDEAKGCEILLAGHNFGCGSSREHAPWALCGYGFRAVVASSFADIFKGNALKNGLLPVQVEPEVLEKLHAARAADPSFTVTIDLEARTLIAPGVVGVAGPSGAPLEVSFPVDPFARTCLLEGVDELGYLLKHLPEIEAHERRA